MPAVTNARNVFQQLDNQGEEYISVRQYIASCLILKGKIESVTIIKIENPELTSRFEKKCQKLLKLTGWSNLQTLTNENNDLSLLGKRGFVFPKGANGMEFATGNITSIDPAYVLNKGNKSTVEVYEPEHTFVFSDIAIGRSFVLDHDWSSTSIPEGYDSFYLPANKLDRNDDGEFDLFEYQQAANFDAREPSNYEHKYFIKDPSQILPRYVIRFKFASEKSADKPNAVADASISVRKAPVNTLDELDFFDVEAHRPVSMRQKMKLAGAKLIVPVDQAFNQALADWKREDPLIIGKKSWLEAQLDSIDERVRQVNLNYADVLEKIQETAHAATVQLQQLTKAKLDTLLSVEVELRRQKEQMIWMETLVAKNFKSLSVKIDAAHNIVSSNSSEAAAMTEQPTSHVDLNAAQRAVTDGQLEFLQIWRHHTIFRNAASRLKPLQHLDALSQVKPDIAVKTDLSVYVDQSVSRGAALTAGKTSVGQTGSNPGRPTLLTSESDKEALKDTLKNLQKNNNYNQPPRPSDDLLSQLLQSVVDVEAGRIQDALSEALKEDHIPLPASLHRPSTTGNIYAQTELLELLTPPVPTASDNEIVNHKELYYASMKRAIGHAPPAAKALVKSHSHHHHHHGQSGKRSDKHQDVHEEAPTTGENQRVGRHEGNHGQQENKIDDEAQAQLILQKRLHEQQEAFEQARILQEQRNAQLRQQQLEEQRRREQEQFEELQRKESMLKAAQGLTDPQLKKGMLHITASTPANKSNMTGWFSQNKDMTHSTYYGTQFTLPSLQALASKYHEAFSLTNQAARRMKQIRTEMARDEATAAIAHMSMSQLLTPAEAQTLYYSLPFFAKPPSVQLVYSSAEQDGRGDNFHLEEIYTASMTNQNPSLVLIRSGDFVFGAYLTHPLRVTSSGWAGSPACFLFSVTLDVKLPYHARHLPTGADAKKPCGFFAEREKLTIGNGDLVICGGGEGHSELENCYGMGLTFGSSEAACFLAGSSDFHIEELEIWSVSS